jgi:hypothetical protein
MVVSIVVVRIVRQRLEKTLPNAALRLAREPRMNVTCGGSWDDLQARRLGVGLDAGELPLSGEATIVSNESCIDAHVLV